MVLLSVWALIITKTSVFCDCFYLIFTDMKSYTPQGTSLVRRRTKTARSHLVCLCERVRERVASDKTVFIHTGSVRQSFEFCCGFKKGTVFILIVWLLLFHWKPVIITWESRVSFLAPDLLLFTNLITKSQYWSQAFHFLLLSLSLFLSVYLFSYKTTQSIHCWW